MDFQRPLLVITPTLDGDVLAALARADVELTGRQLARHVGRGSPEGVRRAADRLVTQGSVRRRTAGAAHLYRLNREHLAAPYIEGLANLRAQLINQLRAAVGSWTQPPKLALLFGSVARGEATAESDLDLLVVRERGCDPDSDPWRTQLLAVQRLATSWTGNDTRVIEYGEEELVDALDERLLQEAMGDGVELFGARRSLRRALDSGVSQ